jgi:hypothetical protein
VPLRPEPFCQPGTRTAIDEEPHRLITSTASSDSLAIIVRAYSRQA